MSPPGAASLRRQLLATLLVQGGGGMAVLLAALLIGRSLGASAQGQFNHLKSVVDLGVALAAWGLPQALMVQLGQGRISRRMAWRSAVVAMALAGPVGALVAWLALEPASLGGAASAAANRWTVLLIVLGVAIAAGVAHALARGLTLLGAGTVGFNVVTALPQVGLLAVAAWRIARGAQEAEGAAAQGLAIGMALVLIACAVTAMAVMRRALAGRWAAASQAFASRVEHPASAVGAADVGTRPTPAPGVLHHGLAVWTAGVCAALSIVVLQKVAGTAGGAVAVGVITLAMLLAQVPLTPLNYAVPILLRHRVRQAGGAGRAVSGHRAAVLGVAILLCVALAVQLVGSAWRGDLGMGPSYAGLHAALTAMLVAAAADAWTRLAAVDAQVDGRPVALAWGEGARLAALAGLAGLWVLPMRAVDAAAVASRLGWCWAAAALVGAGAMALARRGRA